LYQFNVPGSACAKRKLTVKNNDTKSIENNRRCFIELIFIKNSINHKSVN